MTFPRTALAAILVASPALAHEFTVGGLTIGHPMAYETAPSAMTGGGYMTITNGGDEPDRLIGVRTAFPRTDLHVTEERDGIAKMRQVESVEIPPGETVALEPGGLHVMFMGLGGDPLEAGEEIPATLVFEHAGEVDVVFSVEARGDPGGEADAAHDAHGTEPTK